MPTLTNSAQQLLRQVTVLNPKVGARVAGPQDGYGRLRSLEFDARTSKWLVPALEAVNDERIDNIEYSGKGRAVVHFVGDTRADSREPFPIEVALRVLRGD